MIVALVPYTKSTPKKRRLGTTYFNVYKDGHVQGPFQYWWTQSWTNSLEGYKLSDWRQRISRGQSAVTQLNADADVIKSKPFFLEQRFMHYYDVPVKIEQQQDPSEIVSYGQAMGHIRPMRPPRKHYVTSQMITEADNQAKMEYVRKIRGHQTSFQGAVFAGELRETISMIRNPARGLKRGLGRYLSDVKKRTKTIRKLPRKRRSSAIADMWLEHSFGWLPLLNDIDDGIKTIVDSKILSDKRWKRVTGVGESSTTSHSSWINSNAGYPHYSVQKLLTKRCRIKYYGNIDIGSYAAYNARRIGFDSSNWLPAAWELLPYSFLIDYFTNIGEIVSAASLASSSIMWTGRTVVMEGFYHDGSWIAKHYAPSTVTADWPGSFKWSTKEVERSLYSGTLVPNLTFSVPGLGKKWVNISALLRNSKSISRALTR